MFTNAWSVRGQRVVYRLPDWILDYGIELRSRRPRIAAMRTVAKFYWYPTQALCIATTPLSTITCPTWNLYRLGCLSDRYTLSISWNSLSKVQRTSRQRKYYSLEMRTYLLKEVMPTQNLIYLLDWFSESAKSPVCDYIRWGQDRPVGGCTKSVRYVDHSLSKKVLPGFHDRFSADLCVVLY